MKNGIRGTSNIGTLYGGNATNVVMDRLLLTGECRSYNLPLRRRIADVYRKAFEKAARTVASCDGKHGHIKFTRTKKYEAFKLPKSDPSVREAVRVLTLLGMKPTLEYSNGGLDANWLAERGIRVATLGAGSMDAHTGKEKLMLRQFLPACKTALQFAVGP